MQSYKKRGRAGWTGKKEAKTRIGGERIFSKQEIRETLQEIEEGEDFRHRGAGKKTRNKKMRMENRIKWYERIIEEDKRRNKERSDQGLVSYWNDNYWLSALNKLKKKYEEKYGIQ